VRGGQAVSIPSDKAVAVLSGAAGDAVGEFWKLLTFGLAHVEDISGAEPNQNGLVLSADVLLGVLVLGHANRQVGDNEKGDHDSMTRHAATLPHRASRRQDNGHHDFNSVSAIHPSARMRNGTEFADGVLAALLGRDPNWAAPAHD
jgi:hypothetical protein